MMPVQVSAQIGTTSRDLVVFSDGAHLWMPASVLCNERICRDPTMTRNGVGYVDLSALRDELHYKFDEEAGTLKIALHAEAFPETALRLASMAPANIEYPTAPSLFINYSAETSYQLGDNQHTSALGFAEGGISAGHVLAYSSVTATAPGQVTRGLTNLEIDRPTSLQRLTLGDDVVVGGLLGGGGILGGAHLSRDFSLDPYFVAQPTLTQTGVVNAPATVEVYRDGQLVRREVIPAGPFRVQDLTNSPAADTQVIVRDPFGATQMVMTAQILPPAGALKPGLSQYDYSIGFSRRMIAVSSFDYGAPAALFIHRIGITNALTIGARLEGTYDDESRVSSGGSLTFTHDRLDIEATGAASQSYQGTSGAGSLDIGWRLPHATIAGLVRVVGDHYATIDLGPNDERSTFETGATYGWSPRPNTSMSTQVSFEHRSVGGNRERASTSFGFNVSDMRATFSAGASHTSDGTRAFDAMFTLSRSLGPRTTATAGVTHDSAGNAVVANIAHSVPQNRGVGFNADVRLGEQSNGHVLVDAEHEFGRATATVDWFGSALRGSLDVAGGLVAIGGRMKATRPVTGAFALVRIPGAAHVRTYLDNHPIGETDEDGDLILSELTPFYGNRIRIDARDLPIDVPTTQLERLIGPPRRGGAIVAFAAAHTAVVMGSIKSPADYSFGEVIIDGTLRGPIGHEAKFEIEGVRPGHHEAAAEIDDQRCVFEFDVGTKPTINLGSVACKPAAGLNMR